MAGNRKRRWLLIAVAALAISAATWWCIPRRDPRLVGTWLLDPPDPYFGDTMTLKSDGSMEHARGRWCTEYGQLVVYYPKDGVTPPWASSVKSVLEPEMSWRIVEVTDTKLRLRGRGGDFTFRRP